MKTKKNTLKIVGRILFYILLTAVFLLFILPFISVIYTSMRTTGDLMRNGIFSLPEGLNFDSYITVFRQGKFNESLLTSALITIPSVTGAILVGSLGGYALSRMNFKGRKTVFFVILFCMYVPGQMLLIPIYRMYSKFGLTDSFIGIILLQITLAAPFCAFVLRNFFVTVPGELQDAAIIDGCNDFMIYRRILMPLSLPSLAVLAILQFTFVWNSFMWELMLMSQSRPVMVRVINLQGERTVDWAVQCAGAIVASIPTLIVFLSFQKYFIGGLTVGAVKG